jgi:ankyrin repeat protein
VVAELLLRGGADPDARDHSGRTAEALAEEMGQRRVVCMLAY